MRQPSIDSLSIITRVVAWRHAGVHSQPPWALGGHSPQENLDEGLRVLSEMTGAAAPHVLVLSCNLWSVPI